MSDTSKTDYLTVLTIWVAGILMALPLTIPVMNLIVPILGVATYTHIFHRLTAR